MRGGRTVPWVTMWSEEHLDWSGRRGLVREPRDDGTLLTQDPPTCDGCVDEALASCPALHHPVVLDVAAHDLVGWAAAVHSPIHGWTDSRWVFRRETVLRGVVKRRLAGLTRWTERTP